jgi:hypothetical protein
VKLLHQVRARDSIWFGPAFKVGSWLTKSQMLVVQSYRNDREWFPRNTNFQKSLYFSDL